MTELFQADGTLERLAAASLNAFLTIQVLCFSPSLLGQQGSALPVGQVIATVICTAEPSQGYALYLPSSYRVEQKWPILYAFDPAARGRVAVDAFQGAAEKYGYIVVGSNNSRNGPWGPSLAAIGALWADTHARFPLDERRVYTTGFSGGARVATSMAQGLHGQVSGVIACGAGFPLTPEQRPSRDTPFIFFATVGIRDFNFSELRELDTTLASLGITHHLEVFNGGHEWAAKELAAGALEWMDIQAMKSGRRDKNSSLMDAIYAEHLDKARRLDEAGDVARAFHYYQDLDEDFRGLHDVSEVEARLTVLRGSKDLGKALKRQNRREAKIASLESDHYATFQRVMADILAPSAGEYERRQAIRELRLPEFRQLESRKNDSDESIAAERFVRGVMVHTIEEGVQSMSAGEFTRARTELEIATECVPDNGFILYQLARAYALSKDTQSAILALRRSVENGFSDLEQVEKNPDFASLRGEVGYSEALNVLKKKLASSPH